MNITIPREVAELVFGLAELTEDRTPIEQTALECLGAAIDTARLGAKVVAQS